jgi:hypothetical protein
VRIGLRLLVSLIAFTGCSTATEQSTLSRFFAASRLRDTTALKNIARVVFEPGTEGIITSFEITGVVRSRNDRGLESEAVSISAPVKLPSGQRAHKDLVITMQRDAGQWIVTGITDAPPPP